MLTNCEGDVMRRRRFATQIITLNTNRKCPSVRNRKEGRNKSIYNDNVWPKVLYFQYLMLYINMYSRTMDGTQLIHKMVQV